MPGRLLRRRGIVTFAVLVVCAEVAGRALTRHVDGWLHVAPLARTFGLVMKRIVEPETIREVCLYRSTERALSPPAAGFADFLLPWLKRWDREMQAPTRVKRG